MAICVSSRPNEDETRAMTNDNKPNTDLRAGHRERMRARLFQHGSDAFRDDEILEMLLFYAIPRGDVKDLAKTLIKEFGSLEAAIFAPRDKLEKISGIGDSTTALFILLQRLRAGFEIEKLSESTILANWQSVIEYCRIKIGFQEKEVFMALFLNNKHRLLHAEELAYGTVNRVAVYSREVVEHALIHKATAVILVHNHPTGDVTPSKQDIEMTKNIAQALSSIQIELFDHLIVSPTQHSSFKTLGLI